MQKRSCDLPKVVLYDINMPIPRHPYQLSHASSSLVGPSLALDILQLIYDVLHGQTAFLSYIEMSKHILAMF